jgi:hypothetical protein
MSPTQIHNLQVGDLIRFNRTLRKVRAVSSHPRNPGKTYYVCFAKLARSKFRSPFTTYTAPDLRPNHIRLVKRGVRLRTTKTERLLQATIDQRRDGNNCLITQDQTVGIVI